MINERTLPYLLLAPSIAFLLVFFAWPLVEAFVVALTDASGAWSIDNFETMAADIYFQDALVNTLLL
jgi:multiple sugar transport system permease protein